MAVGGHVAHAPRQSKPEIPGTSGPRTILSVFPKEQVLELNHAGITHYKMPACPKGEYVALTVEDTYSWNRNYHADGFQLYQAPVPGSVVAQNLVQRWSTGLIGTKDGLGPGIVICASTEPTDAEKATVMQRQEDYFRYLINEADVLEVQKPNDITDLHRLAGDWMGVHDRKWLKPIVHVSMSRCPACAEEIRAEAKICRWCHTSVTTFKADEAKRIAIASAKETK